MEGERSRRTLSEGRRARATHGARKASASARKTNQPQWHLCNCLT